MTLSPGARLGPYEIQAAIGAGGMGSARGPREEPGPPTRQPRWGADSESSSAAARASGAPLAVNKDGSFALWPC